MRSAFLVCLAIGGWLWASTPVQATNLVVKATGTVSGNGVDQSNTKRGVFGPPGRLAGQKFTLVYTLDESKGTQGYIPDPNGTGLIDQSTVTGSASASAGTATLSIGGSTVAFGNGSILPNSTSPTTQVGRYVQGPLSTQINFLVQDNNTGKTADELARTNIQMSVYRIATSDGDWRTTTPNVVPTTPNSLGYFYYGAYRNQGMKAATFAVASGNLQVENVTIQGIPSSPLSRRICFGGKDVTKTNSTVAAGQPVQMVVGTVGTPCATAINQQQTWQVCGNGIACASTIGGYTPTQSNSETGTVIAFQPTAHTQPSIGPFYWTVLGTQTVTFKYTLPTGVAASAQATFNVVGPSRVEVTPKLSTLGIIDDEDGPTLSFGNVNATPGMQATVLATPPTGVSGDFHWVQLIDGDIIAITGTDGVLHSCTLGNAMGSGLDNTYFYPGDTETDDSPTFPLYGDFAEVSRNFDASMYLMWQATVKDSIPIPLGYFTWGFTGSALQSPQGVGCKTPIDRYGFCIAPFPSSTSGPTWHSVPSFPQWSTRTHNGVLVCHPTLGKSTP